MRNFSLLITEGEGTIGARRVVHVVVAAVAAALFLAPAASAYTAILRPNEDKSSSGWTVVGSGTAWGALDDPVVETEVPSNADAITTTATTGYRRVGMTTAQLGAATIINPTVWWYTPTSPAVEVQVYGTGGGPIAHGTASGAGWHSLSFSLSGAQSQVDALYLDFRPTATSGTRTVSAAFVRFSLEPRILWGSWIDGDVYTTKQEEEENKKKGDAPWDLATWSTFESHVGKGASIIHFGQPAMWFQKFEDDPLRYARERGAFPMMDMDNEEPLIYEEGGEKKEKRVTLDMISEKAVDSQLHEWAKAAREYGYPFFFRWDWEMNATWFNYGDEAVEDPAAFIAAWRHMHDIAEEEGATNITWVWCPNVTYGVSPATALTLYYPGSSYVDWTCLDGYNRGTNPLGASGWIAFSSLYSPSYNTLATNYPTKPIMIGEIGSTEFGGSKAAWIADALETQIPLNFPKIKAMVWFNWNIKVGEKGRWDWQIESSESARAAFSKAISAPTYSADTHGSPPLLTPIKPLP